MNEIRVVSKRNSRSLQAIEERSIETLKPFKGNARVHSKRQIRQLASSIQRFGFTNPVLIADDGTILAGHGRVEAAKSIGLTHVPVVRLSHLSEVERRAYVIADNKLALNAGWDKDLLAIELQALVDLDFEMELTGFSLAEVDLVLDEASERSIPGPQGPENVIPAYPTSAVTRHGDVWQCGRHRVICGDARDSEAYRSLLGNHRADLIFTDPPYNVPIDGHVSGLGRIRHREFAMGAGEMSEAAFTAFLAKTLGAASSMCRDGAIAFVCMDWRHMGELLTAGTQAFTELKNLCVWNKTNGGMGSFYRSKHELIFVFKVGDGPHLNNFGLGETGRYRTNVWDYSGINCFGAERSAEQSMHPTVKPVALVADAIRDCSKRGDIVLDNFAGSGTTLIAAEKTGRQAMVLEYDPGYCDTIVKRWQTLTGKHAIQANTGERFEDVEERLLGVEQLAREADDRTRKTTRNSASRAEYDAT